MLFVLYNKFIYYLLSIRWEPFKNPSIPAREVYYMYEIK